MENINTTFEYEGLTFTPIRRLTGKADSFEAISKRIKDIGITPKNWNYKEFYKIAKQNNCTDIDLFEVNGFTVIAATNYLFQYK